MRRTCPSQRQRLIWIVRVNGVIPVLLYRSWFEMVLGQKILRIRRSDLFWKTSSFLSMIAVVFQHSEPCRSTLRTLLLKICIFVRILMIVDLQTGLSIALSSNNHQKQRVSPHGGTRTPGRASNSLPTELNGETLKLRNDKIMNINHTAGVVEHVLFLTLNALQQMYI